MAQMTMIQAITNALQTELKNDENVLVFGEDVGAVSYTHLTLPTILLV